MDDSTTKNNGLRLFLCGDVMTGRGMDQILPHSCKPVLYESCVKDARDYVLLAERKNGKLSKRPVDFSYPWGDALAILEEMKPDARIINLETAVTTSDANWDKGINYRMHPDNVPCIGSANIDCCVLANNHVLDWGREGLQETLEVLHASGLQTAGAGKDLTEAAQPVILEFGPEKRLLVFGWADESSGVPASWAATSARSGVNFLHDGLSKASVHRIVEQIAKFRRPTGDVVVLSLHWGSNWGYQISREQRQFAHWLIESGSVDILHGHSSHHPRALEIHRGKLIMYGCGDLLNDYEGISGHDEFRDELSLMYFPVVSPADGTLLRLNAAPMQIEKMRLKRASTESAGWLHATMKRECAKFGVRIERDANTNLLTFIGA